MNTKSKIPKQSKFIDFSIHTPTPSDGVVPVVSQEKLPGKLPFGDLPQNRIIGANHFEVRNHKKTTEVLKKTFGGTRDNTNRYIGPANFFDIR